MADVGNIRMCLYRIPQPRPRRDDGGDDGDDRDDVPRDLRVRGVRHGRDGDALLHRGDDARGDVHRGRDDALLRPHPLPLRR